MTKPDTPTRGRRGIALLVALCAIVALSAAACPTSCDATRAPAMAAQQTMAAQSPPVELLAAAQGGGAALGPFNTAGYCAITCGPRLDGGPSADGGTQIDPVTCGDQSVSSEYSTVAATEIYLGPSTVQPGSGRPLCTDTSLCPTAITSAPFKDGSLFCTSETALTLHVFTGRLSSGN